MKHNNFGYLLGEGFRAVFKHGFMSFAAISITVACLVIINSFLLICYNLNLTVEDVQKQTRIVVCIDENYTEAQSKSVGSDINLLDNVANAEFVPRAEALEIFMGDSDRSLFDGLDPQSMRDQFEITLVDNAKISETKAELESITGVAVVYADVEVGNALATIRTVLYIASLAIAAVLLVVSLIIISNTIRLAMLDRREEIAIMKMVGATNSFIRFPFFVEGFILGFFGAVLSFFIEWGLYELIRKAVLNTGLKVLTVVPFAEVMMPMAVICAVAGFFIGIFGSLMSIRRFLKV
ncbi:MAG: permease-like cell division protein FtsX [Oscillospiraceae bacterium]|nr:permease-like cell division protein FtsX [Oscillospiraceae bacterium]